MNETNAAQAPLTFGMLYFDAMTLLDTIAPADTFARVPGARLVSIGVDGREITSDSGITVVTDTVLAEAGDVDVLFIGGGPGTTRLIEHEPLLDYLRAQGRTAAWITSVCTGALVLGAAGLLRGYRATTHWAALELLAPLGAEPVQERVVVDRNRLTGGGVTAGIDFGLTLVSALRGEQLARFIQLGSEYAPAPPFDSGTPATADPALVERFRSVTAPMIQARRDAVARAAARLAPARPSR